MTGNAQILSTLGAPFVLEGLFGEADAEAMMMDDDDDAMEVEEIENSCRKRARSPDGDDGLDVHHPTPKRKRRLLAVRSASLPSASIAVRSRRAERQAKRRRERATMEIDNQ